MALEVLPLYKEFTELVEKSKERSGLDTHAWGVVAFFLVLMLLFSANAPIQSDLNWSFLFLSSPAWLPIVLGRAALLRFLQMRRTEFLSKKKYVLLELRIPRDIQKTPVAMETIFSNLHIGPGESSWHKKYWVGGVRPWWSFELVSLEGTVHFYIWTRDDMRRAVETYVYAQYPEVEIIEAADYSRLRDAGKAPFRMSAYEYEHGKPNPYPIKTYVDYKLDKPPGKDEEQIDPLAQVLELLGSAGPGEQIWIQMMLRTTKSEQFRGKLTDKGKPYTWKDEASELVKKLRGELIDKDLKIPNATEVQKDVISSVERNTGKFGFDVGIRIVYSAPSDQFHGPMSGYIANIFKPFSSEILNSIPPSSAWSGGFGDFPWVNVGGKDEAALMPGVLNLYRRRAYFHPPYRAKWMVMSTEELATLYHIPSSVVKTPTIPRIQSTTAAAPANLPQ